MSYDAVKTMERAKEDEAKKQHDQNEAVMRQSKFNHADEIDSLETKHEHEVCICRPRALLREFLL